MLPTSTFSLSSKHNNTNNSAAVSTWVTETYRIQNVICVFLNVEEETNKLLSDSVLCIFSIFISKMPNNAHVENKNYDNLAYAIPYFKTFHVTFSVKSCHHVISNVII